MFMISIPKKDMPLLNADGCNVTINGKQAVLKRDGDYLCYDDNRCKILEEGLSGNKVQFFAASHGDEDEHHEIICPTGTVKQFPESPAVADSQSESGGIKQAACWQRLF